MEPLLGLALLFLTLDLGILFLLADELLRYQYRCYRDSWEQDRSPSGFFWAPPRPKWSLIRGASLVSWFKRTPEWAQGDQWARRRLQWIRWLGWIWIIGVPLLAAVALITGAS